MRHLSLQELQASLSDTIAHVARTGERISLFSGTRRLAAIVPVEDLDALDAIRDQHDMDESTKALQERGEIDWPVLGRGLRRVALKPSLASAVHSLPPAFRESIQKAIEEVAAIRGDKDPERIACDREIFRHRSGALTVIYTISFDGKSIVVLDIQEHEHEALDMDEWPLAG
jgi:mRNA-degrading endonuclease RelE of RelBE toxin-antitoxin system